MTSFKPEIHQCFKGQERCLKGGRFAHAECTSKEKVLKSAGTYMQS